MFRLQQAPLSYGNVSALSSSVTALEQSSPSMPSPAWNGQVKEEVTDEDFAQHHTHPRRSLIDLPQTPNQLTELKKLQSELDTFPGIIEDIMKGIKAIDDFLEPLTFMNQLQGIVDLLGDIQSTVASLLRPFDILDPIFSAIDDVLSIFE